MGDRSVFYAHHLKHLSVEEGVRLYDAGHVNSRSYDWFWLFATWGAFRSCGSAGVIQESVWRKSPAQYERNIARVRAIMDRCTAIMPSEIDADKRRQNDAPEFIHGSAER